MGGDEAIIRPAEERDFEAIAAITNREIELGVAHFSSETEPAEDLIRRWRDRRDTHPTLVAEVDRAVVGYCHAYQWKPRGAYRWTCEIGVYVHHEHHGHGLGSKLYGALFPELERRGFRTMIAGIVPPNEASVRLHERFGMVHVGTLPAVGFKHGRWRDVGYWVKSIGEGPPGL